MFPMRRPPFDPNLGQPQRVPPTPTLRQLQMQAYQTGAAPRGGGRGWQRGGAVTPAAEITQGTPVVDPNPIGGLGGGFGGFGVGPSGFGGIPQFQRGLDPASAARFRAQIKRNQVLEARGLPPRQIGTPIPYARSVPHPPPGGWNIGGAVDSTEALMAERDRLQQLLQTADEAMAQEIMAQIMEINKELEMAAAPGMAGGGIADLQMQQLQQFTRPRLSPTVAPNWFSGADRRKRNQHLAARGLPMRHQGVPIPYARPVPPWGG